MTHFDCLPGIFYMAKMTEKRSSITHDEYVKYLNIWNNVLDDSDRQMYMDRALKNRTAQ